MLLEASNLGSNSLKIERENKNVEKIIILIKIIKRNISELKKGIKKKKKKLIGGYGI